MIHGTALKLTFMVTTPDGKIVSAGDVPFQKPSTMDAIRSPGQYKGNCEAAGAAIARYVYATTKDELVALPSGPPPTKAPIQ